ncbi:MAG: type IV secretory system conjugative DNA transfer family protein [Oscillospiraceae bacterium]|jgi:type IV secretory pathway TraG/TraD family ATPase VirD4|nr:type IV secretory system conjugative DNA transfer family protein [Oscillospiraceae bacterium]
MDSKNPWWVWALPLPAVWWTALAAAEVKASGGNLFDLLAKISAPSWPMWTENSAKFLLLFTLAYAVGVCAFLSSRKNYRRGVEHGSARWGEVQQITKRYMDKSPDQNLILTEHFRIGLDGYRHKRNLNVLVIGGSGAGKSRSYAIPNVLQCNCSMVVTDPKAEILRKTGNALKAYGYEVRVFDLINPATSFGYNPLAYVQDDKDVLKLIENLIQSTTPPGNHGGDPFWQKSETALLQALVLYLMHEAPAEEQNFPMVMELLEAAQVPELSGEDGGQPESPLDVLFARLEMKNPEHIAVRQYKIFKMGAGKTLRSILISTAVRLAAFNLPQIATMTSFDELHLEELGEKKIALFCCIFDADKSMNYLVGLLYMQLIQTLYFEADRKHKGRLPVPVHLLIDEAPNISLPAESFLPSLATMRSRNIFCSYIAQNMAQIKAIFKEQWESLVGLCDEFLFLGGNEQSTHKYVSELLGKETLDTNTYSQSRDRSGSYSTNFQQAGRELLTSDEVRLLDNGQAILFVRGERPMLDDKFDLRKHPLIGLTEDGGAEPYDYAAVLNAENDMSLYNGHIDDLELLSMEDFLDDDN